MGGRLRPIASEKAEGRLSPALAFTAAGSVQPAFGRRLGRFGDWGRRLAALVSNAGEENYFGRLRRSRRNGS
jgi:hypothetical protein